MAVSRCKEKREPVAPSSTLAKVDPLLMSPALKGNTAALRVGRLVEVRVDAGYRTIADVNQLSDAIDAEVGKLAPSQKVVIVADWRRIHVMSPESSARFRERMVLLNRRTERSAVLVSPEAPVALLQLMRLVREASCDERRIFDDFTELTNWLQEILTPEETKRLQEFCLDPTTRAPFSVRPRMRWAAK
jgi:hypothetical protein